MSALYVYMLRWLSWTERLSNQEGYYITVQEDPLTLKGLKFNIHPEGVKTCTWNSFIS